MSQHSIIEHRANYHFLKIEEDYIAICQGKHRHCKAAILSILENWMNNKRTEASTDDTLFIYMSYPQFVKQMFHLYERSTVIKSLEELEQEGLIMKRPYVDQFNQETFEYRISINAVQSLLYALPAKDTSVGSVKINGGSVKIDYPHVKVNEGSSENKRGGSVNLDDGSFKNKRNIDTTQIQDIDTTQNTTQDLSANADSARDNSSSQQKETENDNHLSPSNVDKSHKPKKAATPKVETPVPPSKPIEPPADMAWGTRKCLQWFDFWRGSLLISKYKLMQASECAKGLSQQFSEEDVIKYRDMMAQETYYIDRGGPDVCDVANNIHKYRNRSKTPLVASTNGTKTRPSVLVSEEQSKKNKERAFAIVAAKQAAAQSKKAIGG